MRRVSTPLISVLALACVTLFTVSPVAQNPAAARKPRS